MLNKIISLLILSVFALSCKNDTAATTTPVEPEQELSDEKKAYIEKYGNPDEQHTHSDKPEAIENNSRVSVPVENHKANMSSLDRSMTPSKSVTQKNARQNMQKQTRPVPHACNVLDERTVAKVIGVDKEQVSVKDGSSSASPYAKSCFFRWEHQGVPNSGVLLQVQDNPVPDEFPEWAAYYIQAKKNEGEKSPDGSLEYKYKDFPGLGIDGAYCYELHRYMWRDKKGFVYLIAFNLPASEDEEIDWARKIGAEVMKNI